ncbi:hypothetical protein ACJJTC_013913 [Scirpophaga incertulas]
MTSNNGTRITLKRKNPNPLFQEWIECLYKQAKQKNSELKPMLEEALNSLIKYPLPLKSGAECAVLKGFRPKLCQFLDQQLEKYKTKQDSQSVQNTISQHNGNNDESVFSNHLISDTQLIISSGSGSQSTNSEPNHEVKSKTTNKEYKPTHRSGGYAILISLFQYAKQKQNSSGLTKEVLIELAQKHSDESFVRPKPGTYYTAWSNITRLIKKGLVEKSGTKKVYYSLTTQGISVATELVQDSQSIPTINDIIFNDESLNNARNHKSSIRIHNSSTTSNSQSAEEENVMCDNMIEMPAGSFDVILLIDKNETGGVTKKNDPTVAQINKYKDMKHEYRSLKVGDFTWIAKHKVQNDYELVLPFIVERKRMDDLASSIKDGRFHEQKFRLRKCGLSNVIYLVEKYNSKHLGLPQNTLLQALANTKVQDGFKIHITNSLTESIRFLAMMTKRLTIKYKDLHLRGSMNGEPSNGQLMSFQYFSKSSLKTKPLTVIELFIKMLLQVNGVSVEKALAITNVYKTPKTLIKAFQSCSSNGDAEKLLSNVKFGISNRNVGPAVSKNLCYIFHKM